MAPFTRQSPSPMSPVTLLLSLLLLSWAPGEAGDSITVQVHSKVPGFLGESATLYCVLVSKENMTITQITWMKNMPDGSRPPVAVFHPKKGPNIVESKRVMFLSAKQDNLRNASLAIADLLAKDEGTYECQFATFPTGSKSAHVRLQVLARPSNTVEALKPTSTSKHVAKCVSVGGRPPARITWSSAMNGSTSETQEPGPQPGTTTVTSFYSVVPSSHSDGKNITCRVEHESVQEPDLLHLTLSLNYPPEVSISGYDGNWYIGRTQVTLTCEGLSKPEPLSYEWSTTTGSLPTSAEPQGNQLRIATVDSSLNNTIFICRVTNALGSRQAQETILVQENSSQPDSGLGSGAISAIVLSVIIGIGIIGIVIWTRKNGCSLRRRSLEREDVRYSSVNHTNSTQDMETNRR